MKVKYYIVEVREIEVDDKFANMGTIDCNSKEWAALADELTDFLEVKTGITPFAEDAFQVFNTPTITGIYKLNDAPLVEW